MKGSRLSAICACVLIASSPTRIGAQDAPLTIIYVNGIMNTLTEAQDTALAIQKAVDESPRSATVGAKKFAVGWVFNPVGWYNFKGINSLEQDSAEVFLLKSSEEVFYSKLGGIVLPHDEDRQVDKVAAAGVVAHLDDMAQGLTSLESPGSDPFVGDDQMRATASAVRGLKRRLDGLPRAIVVAHSQGNLLANLAWAAMAVEHGNRTGQRLRIVNVANTSAISVNGLNFTHQGDSALFSTGLLSINPALEVLPATKGWTRETPHTSTCGWPACPFVLAAPTFRELSGAIAYPRDACSLSDWLKNPFLCELKPLSSLVEWIILNHTMPYTYLNAQSDVTIDVNPVAAPRGVAFPTGRRLVDRFVDFVYAAAAALDRPAIPESPGGSGSPQIRSDGQPTNATVGTGSVASFQVLATGTAPLTYQWRRDGVAVPCSSAIDCSRLDWTVAQGDNGVRFDVVISNAFGSVTSAAATVTVVSSPTPTILTVAQLKGSFDRTACASLWQTGAFSALAEYRGCGSLSVGDFELRFEGCTLRNRGGVVTLTKTIGQPASISLKMDATLSGASNFAGDSIEIGRPDPGYAFGSSDAFNLFVGDFREFTYASINLRTDGQSVLSLNAQDFLTGVSIGCPN